MEYVKTILVRQQYIQYGDIRWYANKAYTIFAKRLVFIIFQHCTQILDPLNPRTLNIDMSKSI